MASERPGMGPGIERSKSIEDLHHLRLMALLDELVRDKGARKAAADLDVDHRTLAASLESGRLTRRMRVALDRALLAGGGSPAREQQERNEELAERLERVEGRVEVVGQDAGQGLAAVGDEVKALRNEQGQALQRVESRLVRVEASGGDAGDAEMEVGESGPVGRSPERKTRLRREFPELVDPGACGGRRRRLRRRLAIDSGVAGAEGEPPQPGKGPGVAAAAAAAVGSGTGLARRARSDPAAGDVPVAGAGPGRPGQLASQGAG